MNADKADIGDGNSSHEEVTFTVTLEEGVGAGSVDGTAPAVGGFVDEGSGVGVSITIAPDIGA